jgi:hypothetical protein
MMHVIPKAGRLPYNAIRSYWPGFSVQESAGHSLLARSKQTHLHQPCPCREHIGKLHFLVAGYSETLECRGV